MYCMQYAPAILCTILCLLAPAVQFLVYSDLQPLMECILLFHPGLEFLKETAEFQKKYAETVIYRIFYSLNRWAMLSCCHHACRG